ncbi:MAG: response regulator [Pseudobdellovibrionaceae bacterium]
MAVRILIADDAGFVRELLTQACEALGFVVVGEARNGEEAIQMALQRKPDIILMDLVMPKYNGLEATEQILAQLPNIDIIACSSMDDEITLQQALNKGCRAFLRKPFTKQSILSVFRQIKDQRKGMKNA